MKYYLLNRHDEEKTKENCDKTTEEKLDKTTCCIGFKKRMILLGSDEACFNIRI